MMRTTLRGISTLTLMVAFVAPAFAQTPPPPPAPPALPGTATTASTVRAKSILGTVVHIRGGRRVGTVEDIVLNSDGVVDYLIVAREGKLVTVPWDAARINYGKRVATIDLSQDQYEKIPTYTTEKYPEYYTPTYRTQIYRYYNLTPGTERRLERRTERRER